MTIHDYTELLLLALWLISLIFNYILNKIRFKNKRLEQFRITIDKILKEYISIYDKEALSNDEQINKICNAIIDALQKKGFNLTEQDIHNVFKEVIQKINNL